MNVVKVVPGTRLQSMIESGASESEIAKQVKSDALANGLTGEVGFLIDIPDEKEKVELPTKFVNVA